MAFLDNSGDIILDAVLTEAGRRRMAEGNFKITKFALGDDEIDYSLYNKNHASGSAYYDLEILQTPIFEAFTQVNAGINYGLLPTTATDLLYLPIMKVNELTVITADTRAIASSGSSGMFMVTDSSGDDSSAAIRTVLSDNSINSINGNSPQTCVLLETGLNTGQGNVPNGTAANRKSYLAANGLIDSRLVVFYDSRFFNGVKGLAKNSGFSNNGQDNALISQLILSDGSRASIQSGLDNYAAAMILGIKNQIVQPSSGTDTEADLSVISGPKGIVAAVAPTINPGLDAEYSLYGGETTIGISNCKFIDTTIFVQGTSTSAQLQIPIRIIKLA